jgi:hypothetical protein
VTTGALHELRYTGVQNGLLGFWNNVWYRQRYLERWWFLYDICRYEFLLEVKGVLGQIFRGDGERAGEGS